MLQRSDFYFRKTSKLALVIASFQPTKKSSDLLRIALNSIIKSTEVDYSVWVIDVGSPKHDALVKPEEFKEINFVYVNYTPLKFSMSLIKRIIKFPINIKMSDLRDGSYINSWSLNYAIRLFDYINYIPDHFMTLQMDIMVIQKGWLKKDLLSRMSGKVIAVGVRGQMCFDKSDYILHSLGCLWNYKLFKKLNLNFEAYIPRYDVGEYAIVRAKKMGYEIISLVNSYNDEINFNHNDPFKTYLYDKTFNEEKEIIFLHLGRGIVKSEKGEIKGKVGFNEWEKVFYHYYPKNIKTLK